MTTVRDQDLGRLMASNMGWLSPDGELLVCRLHGHLEGLARVASLADAYERYRETCDGNARSMRADLDALGPDEHPAMHRFAGMDDDARDEFVRVAYVAGWIRLGRAKDADGVRAASSSRGLSYAEAYRLSRDWYVEAEGLGDALRARIGRLDHIARGTGSRLVLRAMRYETVNLGTRRRPNMRELLVPDVDPSPEGRAAPAQRER